MSFEYSELVKLIRYKFGTQDMFAKALGSGEERRAEMIRMD